MNISKYIIYIPYRLAWLVAYNFRKNKTIHFYCAGQVDYVVMESIIQHFPEGVIVAKNRKVRNELKQYGIESKLYPTFPDIVVIPRHTARKYPEPRIKKVGMRHGASNFKGNVKASRFHAFDIYFVASQREVKQALDQGIENTYAIGFTKMDPYFNGQINKEVLDAYKKRLILDVNKPTIIFTATWNKSGMSAIDQWINHLEELSEKYNILVTVHHWMEKHYIKNLINNKKINFLTDKYILPYLLLSDLMIADSSSIIGDFCTLDKPIITFRVPYKKKVPEDIIEMIETISFRINTYDELVDTIEEALKNPGKHAQKRKMYNSLLFESLDGNAGKRAANKIKELFFNEEDI